MRLPVTTAVEEQVDAVIHPGVEFGLRHRRAEAEGAALRQGDDELEELLGGECRAVDRQAAGTRLAFEQGGDLPDHLGPAAFVRDHRRKLGEALRLGDHQAIQCQRHRHQGGAPNISRTRPRRTYSRLPS
jgi:hypothetical protein